MKTKALLVIFILTLSINAGIGEGQSSMGALPVELTNFTASENSHCIQLNWTTATEIDNYGFEVERASPSSVTNKTLIWSKCGFIEGHGNSNSQKEYSFIDEPVFLGNYQYRLKQIDTDGSFIYSKIIEVEFGKIPTEYVLKQNYPTPFNPTTVISYAIPTNSFVSVKVYDLLGNLIATLVNCNQEAGIYMVSFTANKLSNGIYFYRISVNDFLATKKMLLIK